MISTASPCAPSRPRNCCNTCPRRVPLFAFGDVIDASTLRWFYDRCPMMMAAPEPDPPEPPLTREQISSKGGMAAASRHLLLKRHIR